MGATANKTSRSNKEKTGDGATLPESLLPEVKAVLDGRGEPRYRIKQAYAALAKGLVRNWSEATDLPRPLREALTEHAPATVLDLKDLSKASDGTRKYLFHTADGHAIETVMIPERDRRTVCISTQVGCPMACKFCATGLLGIKRNLKAREIAEQVLVVQRDLAGKNERVTNIVVMGMGEPFLNYDATIKALRVINDSDGFNLAARHIAVSTSGLIDKIRRFADEPEQFHLAISLHNPFENERREIMPVASRHSVSELMSAARYFVDTTRRKLFFEYTLLEGVNDQPRHVEKLAQVLDHPLYHLNLLRFNWTDTGFAATSKRGAREFLEYAKDLGLSATLRPSRGNDIDAACGQLAAKDLQKLQGASPVVPLGR
ncbi:23S rRNA (adenine(2503)-C(2))-methyltransferase RlmN [Rubrobacter indicoceani]|uniref:23S rRNA (adenine(2503)-C(2))-methyltransferase RlmN n=1 Tax=Rubrobacter indicoceani TaxID=2051957 RepID=UPI000E5B35CB|nr:23S rRNA (adenine(2503)-C(2))-methyltransferase RlmN [Rubrobacter indicoceani]